MSRQFNKDRFEVVIKLVYGFLRYSVVALYVLIAIIGLGWIVTWFLPQGIFDFNLANLEQTNVNIFGLDYDLAALGLNGIVNVKSLVVLGIFAMIANLTFFQYVLVLLKRIMKHVASANPFSSTTVTYLKWMGYGFLAASVLLPIANGLFFNNVIDTLDIFEFGVNFSLNIQSIFVGVLILIVAYIFDYGAYLQEEHDMTV